VGVGRYIRSADDDTHAELAFEVTDTWRGRGLGTFLLGALAVAATEAGIDHFRGEVLHDNLPMRAVFDKVGARWEQTEPGVVVTTISVEAALELIDDTMRTQLARAVHDVVTGAGLALVHPRP
jgi:RimJ/RimL family protein N-acetyltransferase